MSPVTARKQIRIRGVVQGIGFRPFLYHLAHRFQLCGHVQNTSEGVLLEVEGAPQTIDQFLQQIVTGHPPFARIEETVVRDLEPTRESGFAVRESRRDESQFALVSPDLATCEDCRREFADPQNRRYQYPFTNCTNCGPRYSIIYDIPYDRPVTTMAGFRMCAACQAEYDDPANRRFHAQPNACPVCGPSLSLEPPADASADILSEARRRLAAGQILAIKGLGGFQLACAAENDNAVRRLRERKRRSDKPFALMVRDIAAAEQICFVARTERQALLNPERPIVILPRRHDARISPAVAPDNQTLGVMLPYTPLHHLLFAADGCQALVMTSGNLAEEPIVTSNVEARERLAGIADAFLFHDRDIYVRVDDSVVRCFEGLPRVLRRARGYTPQAIDLGTELPEVLACGGELKNTFCLTKGRYALLSQHLGDLENYETLTFFEETLGQMKKLFRIDPRVVVHDLHPHYLSTRFAQELQGVERIAVQHHHAHIAACMAENHLRERVIGVAFDGTGYGTDGQIWGGEFLIADFSGFERRAHFRYVPLAGGDQAVREPWRMAVSYLMDTFGAECPVPAIPSRKLAIVRAMIQRGVNTVQTSSCGRLFDAVAAILGLHLEVNFEGQAAIRLETVAQPGIDDHYDFVIEMSEPWRIDMRPAIREIVAAAERRDAVGLISARFHNTIAAVIAEVCERLRKSEKLNQVCLSGGTFQNVYLLARAVAGLRRRGFEVFLHAQVPTNDGGLSLGQAAIGTRGKSRGFRRGSG